MKIGLLNDTHLGLTSENQLMRCFLELAAQKPDMIIHAGDYSGNQSAAGAVKRTCELLREAFPTIPILTVIGNHDFWCGHGRRIGRDLDRTPIYAKPSLRDFVENYEAIKATFKEHRIHFFDEDGNYRPDDRFGFVFVGCSGWYAHNTGGTNDYRYLPTGLEGDTFSAMSRRAQRILDQNLSDLKDDDLVRVFVSHFPVLRPGPWGWNRRIGKILRQDLGFSHFINGHIHRRETGPYKFCAGSDYYLPRFLILNI